ncbi:ABC transporter permease [Motiliproteus sediminis]|uniref:ABC transporter permease n=1 Tax=Motiliproteus sediminis TaxID=1468178 RepID=UPI001AEFFDBB|nr:FtsX-like permease family protein [Motiliproteus sediminis]
MTWTLALRLLAREWRSGELRLLTLALAIAITASCAVGFFTDRVERALLRQATTFLGADLALQSAHPSQLDLRRQARNAGLSYSEQQRFSTMVSAEGETLLVSVKAVDSAYPLRGDLRLSRDIQAQPFSQRGAPATGTLWAEPRVLQGLNASPEQPLTLGISQFTLGALIVNEPDRGGGLISLRPRLIINLDDLPDTRLVQPGSRVTYRYLFSGDAAAIQQLRDWLTPQLRPGERLLDVRQENPSIGGTMERARRYINLSGLLAVSMAAIAIAMAARRYTRRHYDTAALLRCLGQSQGRIMRLFCIQLLVAGTLATLLGIALGWLAQWGLVALLGELLQIELPPGGWRPALTGAATGLLILLATALPPLLQLASVSPLRVLRRELAPIAPASTLIYGLAISVAIGLLWLYSGDYSLAILLGGGSVAGTALLAGLGWLLLRLVGRIPGPLPWRLALKNLYRHPRASLTQLTAFGLTLAAMALILVVRTDLVRDWQAQLPEDAPNHFLINIQPWEVDLLKDFLLQSDVRHSGIHPMIRGRLSHINGKPAAEQIPPDAPGRRGIRRELNLSWSADLAPDNRIEAGRWWQPQDYGRPYISLEAKLAKDLGVTLGDQLRFSFGDRQIDAEILSLRSLDWSSLRPNFFVIFAPGSLADLPATSITSFYLPASRGPWLRQLVQQFPTLTLLEVAPLLENLRAVVAQVSLAAEYVLFFVLAAGITVLFAGLANSIDERLRESALLRTLGAGSTLIRRMLSIEFLLLGALSGLLAALLAQAGIFALYQLLQLAPRFHLLLWISAPLVGALLVWLAGRLATERILHQAPIALLRDHQD